MRRTLGPLATRLEGSTRPLVDYDRLLAPLENTSILQLLERFPDEHSCVRLLFELRGGPMRPCSICGSRTIWRQDSNQPLFNSKCCGERIDARAGTFFGRARLDIRMWLYLIATFLNRPTPLSSAFVGGHLDVSSGEAWRALAQIRQQIEEINLSQLDARDYLRCYVDEFRYGPLRGSAQGGRSSIWLLGISGNGVIHVEPLYHRYPGEYRHIMQRLGLLDVELFSRNHALVSRLREDNFLPTTCECTMASQGMALVQADGRLSAFWPFFKRSLRRGSVVASRQHIHRYVSEYVFRYNYSGREGLMFRQIMRSVKPL